MNSGMDLLAEGFPHSDIRGSTIARISPRLFAACHVLLRLLAPRHPPNALFALNTSTHTRTQDQAPRRLKAANQCSAVHTLKSNQPIRFTCQTASHLPSPLNQVSSYLVMQLAPRTRTEPQPRPKKQNHGDGRIRTDDPLLAKQVLSR